jgi:acyl dehydratase
VWYFRDFELGQRFATDHLVSAASVAAYNRLNGYRSPVFADLDAARAAGFERLPVPAFYATTYQFIASVPGVTLPLGGFYAKQEFRVLGPCFVGDRLHTEITVEEKYERRGRLYIAFDAETVNQSGEPVMWGRRTRSWPE